MAYDRKRRRLVVFGGEVGNGSDCDGSGSAYCAGTWELDYDFLSVPAFRWERACLKGACSAQPDPRSGAAMVYDERRQVMVLFGGLGVGRARLGDTWEWDGSDWTQRCEGAAGEKDFCPKQPLARSGHTLAWDPSRSKVILYGGDAVLTSEQDCTDPEGGSCAAVWEWDGSTWIRAELYAVGNPPQPTPRGNHGVAYDAAQGELVVAGGAQDRMPTAVPLPDTWVYSGAASSVPAHVARIRFAAAGTDGQEDITGLRVVWYAGGAGESEGAVVAGARLLVWDVDRWRTVATNLVAPPAAGTGLDECSEGDPLATDPCLTWTSTDAAELAPLIVGEDRTISLAVIPSAPSGTRSGFAEVATEYLEVTLRYDRALP